MAITKVVDDTAHSCTSTPSWVWTVVAGGHKFLVVRHLSQGLLDWPKNAIFTYPTCIWRPHWGPTGSESTFLENAGFNQSINQPKFFRVA